MYAECHYVQMPKTKQITEMRKVYCMAERWSWRVCREPTSWRQRFAVLATCVRMWGGAAIIVITSKEPVCPRVELILQIIIILLIIFLGFIKSKPC